MEGSTHLARFLRGCVTKRKRERYAGLVSQKKGQKKFLSALDHDLERDIDQARVVDRFSDIDWTRSAIFYSSRGSYGIPAATVRQAYDNAPWDGGWLIVSASGICGVYRPEGRMDDEMFIKL